MHNDGTFGEYIFVLNIELTMNFFYARKKGTKEHAFCTFLFHLHTLYALIKGVMEKDR